MSNALFRNKKGQVVDFFAGIQRAISWVLTSAPKPLLLIFFLLFLIVFSAIFGIILNTTGHFCDTAGNEYKTGAFSIVTNFGLIGSMPSNDELNSEVIDATDLPLMESTVMECTALYRTSSAGNWTYIDENNDEYDLPSGYYFKNDGCIICENPVKALPPGLLGGWKSRINICLDNIIYPKTYDDMGFIAKRSCGETLGRCAIPLGYYFDRNTATFVCDDELCSNEENGTNNLGEIWNLKLKEKGAKIQPPSPYGDRDYRNILRIECDNGNVTPKLRLAGIDIFNYKLWVMLMILSALLWAVFKIKQH